MRKYTDIGILAFLSIIITYFSSNDLFIGMTWGAFISLLYGKTKFINNDREIS